MTILVVELKKDIRSKCNPDSILSIQIKLKSMFSSKTQSAALYGFAYFGATVAVYGLVPVELPVGPLGLSAAVGAYGAYRGYSKGSM